MVRILGVHCHGLGLVPGPRTEIPQAVRHSQKAKKKKNWKERRQLLVMGCFLCEAGSKVIGHLS